MHVRTARALALSPTAEGIEGTNFLSGTTFTVDGHVVSLLDGIRDWTHAERAADQTGLTRDDLRTLLDLGLLLERDSPEALKEREFEGEWHWGQPAAALHFSIRDRSFMPVDVSEREQVERSVTCPSPPLARDNAEATIVSLLPKSSSSELLTTMARRRTVRESKGEALPLALLSDVLLAGLGITGRTSNAAGELPLKMTPSGGARNPYEAYVYVRNVGGLVAGVHHYSARERTLGLVNANPCSKPSALAGDQDWIDSAAAIIFLVAHLDRTMWKYEDPNAYRVVLIEAGHIGQNAMLVATQAGWSACPTAAINRSKTLSTLAIPDRIVIEPVYALALMKPREGLPIPTELNPPN